MANCSICTKPLGFFSVYGGRCESCYAKFVAEQEAARRAIVSTAPDPELIQRADAIILTTETAAADLVIAERLGIVTAECVFGMHLFKDVFAAFSDAFGGRSGAVQNTLKDARNTAFDELRLEAAKLGADAVIAVDLDYSEISGGGKSMLFLVASGTAVKLG